LVTVRNVVDSKNGSALGQHRFRRRILGASDGFTLIELMIVITIILILASMAAVRYDRSVLRSKEAALHQDLSVMRQAIEQYTLDKEQAPQSLDDLVTAEYLRQVPVDPITGGRDWNVTTSDMLLSPEQSSAGISDVHSSSDKVSPFENTPYNTW
jgi:general secretion pathway protein G